MKVSFLVTYYNQEQYVRQSLDSILAVEKPFDWEILVGDDGSSDGTVGVVQEYIDRDPEHIRLFVMPREAGVRYDPVRRASANRLHLLETCTGDCFCTLDGDDFYCDTSFVREAADILERHPDVSFAAFQYGYYMDGRLGEGMGLPAGMQGLIDTRQFLKDGYVPAGAGVHRIFRDSGRNHFLKEVGLFDDNNIVMNSLNFGSMYYTARPVYAYRQTGGSVYNRMDRVEKAILNVEGWDADRQILRSAYHPELLIRNATSIIDLYVCRKTIRKALGVEKYTKYVRSCEGLRDSAAADFLAWDRLSREGKARLRSLFMKSAAARPEYAVRALGKALIKPGA